MTNSLAQPPNHAPAHDESQQWNHGRLVVNATGEDAGAMRLDLDLPDFDSVEEVIHHVHLLLPGEASPLSPFDAVGENGRFIISFFSTDISNAGQLPGQAAVGWSGVGSHMRVKSVPIECATSVAEEESVDVSVVVSPAGRISYPATVLLAVSGGLLVMSLATLAFLIFE